MSGWLEWFARKTGTPITKTIGKDGSVYCHMTIKNFEERFLIRPYTGSGKTPLRYRWEVYNKETNNVVARSRTRRGANELAFSYNAKP